MLHGPVVTEASQILSWTVEAHDTGLLDFLLQRRRDVNHPDEEGQAPLFIASTLGHAYFVRQLLTLEPNCSALRVVISLSTFRSRKVIR